VSDKHFRNVKQKLKTAKGRKISSTKWLQRHLNDPYVNMAKQKGYRSRAAYKLIEIDEKFHVFKNAHIIIDLGAAPGGWTQVAKEKSKKDAFIVAIDLKEIEPIEGITFIHGDLTLDENEKLLQSLIPNKADLIMSDMAANSCGEKQIDHLRIAVLVEIALSFATNNLKYGGNFVAKMLKGGEEKNILDEIRKHFKTVKYFKPDASYDDSGEIYVVALGFKNT
jgi:23S rRNA (uridine2552-2'-O)-methyltransferase